MTISVVDLGTNDTASGITTVTLTNVTVPAGAWIVVGVVEGAGTTISGGTFSDGINSYSKIFQAINNNRSTNGNLIRFLAQNVNALNGATLTYTKSAAAGASVASMSAMYATGLIITGDIGFSKSAFGSSGAPSISSGVVTGSGDLAVGIVGWNGLATDSFTQDSINGAYAAPPDFNEALAGAQIAGGFIINSGTQAVVYAPTITSHPWGMIFEGYVPAPAPAPIILGNQQTFM